MRHAVKILIMSGLTVCASLSGCSVLGGDDDNDGTSGASNSSGGAAGGGISVGKGGASSNAGTSSTAGNSSSSGGSGTTGPGTCDKIEGIDPVMCGTSSVEAQIKTVNMMLVIDKSGSMDSGLDGTPTGTPTKWVGMQQALAGALKNVQNDINFGMILFPSAAASAAPSNDYAAACQVDTGAAAVDVPITTGSAAVTAIAGALTKTKPAGGTPTAQALKAAYDYFTTGEGTLKAGDKYVLLATDGGPNCNQSNICESTPDKCTCVIDSGNQPSCCKNGYLCLDDSAVLEQINNLSAKGIATFVVGVPGTEAYSTYLDEFAVAGGKVNPDPASPTKYYKVDAAGGVAGLQAVFQTITTQLVRSCDIKLTENPQALDKVNVAIDCNIVPQTGAWDIDDSTDPNILRFKGKTCENIQSAGAKRVDVVFGCSVIK